MRSLVIVFLSVIVLSCGGSLNEEQREALKKEKNAKKIRKVSEDEIYQKALQNGRDIMSALDQGEVISEVEGRYKVSIARVDESTPDLEGKEIELWETYKNNDWQSVDAEDNVQKNGNDYLVYTFPVIGEKEDSVFLSGLWMVRMQRKEIVLSL